MGAMADATTPSGSSQRSQTFSFAPLSKSGRLVTAQSPAAVAGIISSFQFSKNALVNYFFGNPSFHCCCCSSQTSYQAIKCTLVAGKEGVSCFATGATV